MKKPINLIFRISIKQQEDPQRSTLNLLDGSMVETITSKILPTNSIVPSIGEGIIEWAVSSKNQKVRAHLYAALLNFINLQPDFYGELTKKIPSNFDWTFQDHVRQT